MEGAIFIERAKRAIIQIATPYSIGTAFYLEEYDLIITNEHLVRDNREVVVDGEWFDAQLVEVLYIDEIADIALLSAPRNPHSDKVGLRLTTELEVGAVVAALGHPFGAQYQFKQGELKAKAKNEYDVSYLEHTAGLQPDCSGGPLLDKEGFVVGLNTFWSEQESFSIPSECLQSAIEAYRNARHPYVVRCPECRHDIPDMDVQQKYCTHCGSQLSFLSQINAYEPIGVNFQIESLLDHMGYNPVLARRGPYNWEVQRGSALIHLAYHEKTGLINGDAHLCRIPEENVLPLYEFMLKANYELDSLSFTVRGNEVILTLLIYDQYLNPITAKKLLEHLFDRSDHYDDILVDQYGASWL